MSLRAHLGLGATTVARAWAIARLDGAALAFTDHDRPLRFEGLTFRPDAALAPGALVAATGLSVDNAEASGALRADAVSEADLEAGRYDGAEVRLWHVNWADPSQRSLRFRGTVGEVRRGAGAFHAELRGLSEALNRPTGRHYLPTCDATLGDARCGVALGPLAREAAAGLTDGRAFRLLGLGAEPPRRYEHGRLLVLDGAARGLSGTILRDAPDGAARVLTLAAAIRAPIAPGDRVRVTPGCDRSAETCRSAFGNLLNFRGFPTIPGEDWLLAVPARAAR